VERILNLLEPLLENFDRDAFAEGVGQCRATENHAGDVILIHLQFDSAIAAHTWAIAWEFDATHRGEREALGFVRGEPIAVVLTW